MKIKNIIFLLLSMSAHFSQSSNMFDVIVPVANIRMRQTQRVSKRSRLSNAQLTQEYLQQMTSKHLTDEGFDLFEQAMHEKDFETMQKIIAASDLESENEENLTPLIMAICQGNRKVVQMLLKAGAEIDHGWRALTSPETLSLVQVALMKRNKDCVKDLLYAGAKIPERLIFLHYVWLQEIKEEMNATSHNVQGAFDFARKQTDRNVHPMIQERMSQMLLYPKESSLSSQDSD